jgi:tripartite-type tricarboxylate transporter receptor subunit TctC
LGASLSVAAGAHLRWLSCQRYARHRRAPRGPIILSERLGQPVVIENRPGAAGNIATEAVVRATPDGYTLLLANGANAISATLYEKLSFDFIRDIAPVASIGSAALVLVTNLSFPAKTVPEFIAYAKANPSKINMASVGVGASTPFLAGELFKAMTGVEWVWVASSSFSGRRRIRRSRRG